MVFGFVVNEATQSWGIYLIKMVVMSILVAKILAVNANTSSPHWILSSVRFGISIQYDASLRLSPTL